MHGAIYGKKCKKLYYATSGALWVVRISFRNGFSYRLWIMAGLIDHFFGRFESILFPKQTSFHTIAKHIPYTIEGRPQKKVQKPEQKRANAQK